LCHGDRGAGSAAGGALPGVLDPGEVQAAAAEAAAWQVHAAFGQQGHPHTVLLCEGLPSPVNTSSDTHLPSEGFRGGHAAGGSPGRRDGGLSGGPGAAAGPQGHAGLPDAPLAKGGGKSCRPHDG